MSVYIKYLDEVEITSALVGPFPAWTTVDLTPFLLNTGAVGASFRATSLVNFRDWQTRALSSTVEIFERLFFNAYNESASSLSGGTALEIYASSTDVRVFLTGEFHAPAVFYDNQIDFSPPEPEWNQWIDHTPTPQGGDVIGDIDYVIVKSNKIAPPVGFASMALRQKGSTMDSFTQNRQAQSWWVVGLDAQGTYQVFSEGISPNPKSHFVELGYILKDSRVRRILNPVAESNPTQIGSFGTIDFSGVVEVGAITVGGRWQNTLTPTRREAYLRGIGSSENLAIVAMAFSCQSQAVTINSDGEAEYQVFDGSRQDYFVHWYELSDTPPVFTNTPDTTVPAGTDYNETMTATYQAAPAVTLVFALRLAPDAASINSTTGVITWVPDPVTIDRVYRFIATVTEPSGLVGILSWSVCVQETQMLGEAKATAALTAGVSEAPTLGGMLRV